MNAPRNQQSGYIANMQEKHRIHPKGGAHALIVAPALLMALRHCLVIITELLIGSE